MRRISLEVWRRVELRNYFILIALFAFTEGMLAFRIPLLVDEQLGGYAAVGLMLGLSNFAGLLVSIVFGFVTEVTSFRKFLDIGSIISWLMLPILLFGEDWIAFILLVILWGARFDLVFNFGTSLFLAKHTPVGKFTIVSGLALVVRYLGIFGGPLLANLIEINDRVVFVVLLAMVYLLEHVLMLSSFTDHPGRHHRTKVFHLSLVTEFQIMRSRFWAMAPHFFLGMGVAGLEAVFLIFAPVAFSQTYPQLAGLLTVVGLLAYLFLPAIIRVVTGKRMWWVMTFAFVGTLFFLFLLSGANMPVLLAVAIFGLFLMSAVAMAINDGIFLRILNQDRVFEEDEIMSVRGLSSNVAFVLVAVAGALLADKVGFIWVVLGTGALFCLSMIAFMIFKPNEAI